VISYHYGVTWLPGGFVGVDIFFVISGYLITQRLAADIDDGQFSLVSFYGRRIRRIVPALVMVLLTTLAASYFLLLPGDYASLGQNAQYAAFGLSNLFFYGHTGYFDRSADLLPLLHTWSLGVEEQFYLCWPLLLWGILRIHKKRGATSAGIAAGLALVSFGFGLYQLSIDPKAAFYLPLGRAWELLLGAALALVQRPARRAYGGYITMTGLSLIAGSVLFLSTSIKFPGWAAAPSVIGACLVIAFASDRNALASALPRMIGLVSYSLYLWHWPVLVLFRIYNNSTAPTGVESWALFTAVLMLSFLSWRYVEQPFRKAGRARDVVIVGLATSMCVAALGMTISRQDGFPGRLSPDVQEMRSLDAMWAWECPVQVTLPWVPYQLCNFGANWSSASHRALVWGDSHAEHLAPIINAAKGRAAEYAFLLYLDCPAALGSEVQRTAGMDPAYPEHCAVLQSGATEMLQTDPTIDRIIFSANWATVAGTLKASDAEEQAKKLSHGLQRLIEDTRRSGRRFVIVGDTPQFKNDPVPCAITASSESGLFRRDCIEGDPTPERDTELKRVRSINGELERLAMAPDVQFIDPMVTMCPSTRCLARLNDEFLYRDPGHLRRNLSIGTLAALAAMLNVESALE
jgi:peptidoglycan/LPS O-acetylase OafA/YrhL